MSTYKWVCQACEHVNAPEVSTCQQCTCPANASRDEIEQIKQGVDATKGVREFFTTSSFKLAVMSLSTFSLYLIYWFYKNWQLIKKQTPQSKVMPLLRAFFSPLFAYSCFRHIQVSASRTGVTNKLHIGYLALAYFLLTQMSNAPHFYGLIGLLAFLPVVPMNNAALAVNVAHNLQFQNNDKFSILNRVGITLGTLLWLMMIIGIMGKANP